MNKGKRSLAVDMKSPEGRELITRVITAPGKDAGLFLTNLRVRGWMDHETLSKYREDLIMVTLMGDRRGRPQVDYTVNPALGIPEMTGPEGHDGPVANALPAWDLVAGNMVVSSLLAAERHRLRTGHGQDVELSLKDVAAATLGHLGMIGDAVVNEAERGKSGNALYGAYGQDFITSDEKRIMVIGLTARQWKGLVNVTQTGDAMAALSQATGQDLGDEGVRWALRHQITDAFAPWFAAQTAAKIAAQLDEAGVTWSQFRSVKEAVAEDVDLSPDNPMFQNLHQPGLGTFPVPGAPMTFSSHARTEPVKAPALGAHTEEILGDVVGMDDTEIARLFDTGVVQSPNYAVSRQVA
jgi:2-methylfumaryl-CoA isomerase